MLKSREEKSALFSCVNSTYIEGNVDKNCCGYSSEVIDNCGLYSSFVNIQHKCKSLVYNKLNKLIYGILICNRSLKVLASLFFCGLHAMIPIKDMETSKHFQGRPG